MNAQKIAQLALCTYLLLPAGAWAQTAVSGAIAGVVRDTSSGVLPGVTVEAASPALIEKVRSAVTDGQGAYRIVDLRPGTYSVTFTLPGFRTVRREGIELTTGFTAAVNADLQVGALEETITVTGESPIVDTSNVRTQQVFSRDALDALPVSRTNLGYVTLLPGASMAADRQDVGGSMGDLSSNISIHGSRGGDMIVNLDGMRIHRGGQGGGFSSQAINQASVQEITFQTSGMSAESETGGVQLNVVPREGGNIFSGYGAANYSNTGMQGENIGDELVRRGLQRDATLKIDKVYDGNLALGGPIKRDRLWFYTAQRWWGTKRPMPVPGNFFNKNHGTDRFYVYEPDLSRPHKMRVPRRSHNARLTWQAAEKHKLTFLYDAQPSCNCPQVYEGLIAPEAMAFHKYVQDISQATWSNPATNRLLFDAGVTYYHWDFFADPNTGVSPNDIAMLEQSNGMTFNGRAFSNTVFPGRSYGALYEDQYNARFAVSYVTGSHNFKTGMFWMFASTDHDTHTNGDVLYTLLNGVPISITQFTTPSVNGGRAVNSAFYAQDQWTPLRQLTLNLGVRFDSLRGWSPEMSAPAGRWVPARQYDRVDDLPNFTDLSPRLGAAYDVFGNGRTAVKASLGRYVQIGSTALAVANSPSQTEVFNATRTWNDLNSDWVPQEHELGPSSNSAFGTRRVRTRLADDVRTGFDNREHNWQASAVLEHELRPGVAFDVGYFRTWYGNPTVTDNVAVTPVDFKEFCITAPVDSRLPGGGGNQICGLYDVTPVKFGQVDNLITLADRSEVYNGVDVNVRGRLRNGAQVSGGVSTGRTVIDNCGAAIDSPEDLRFCRQIVPLAGQTQLRMSGNYPLLWDFAAGVSYQDLPGVPISADHVVTNAAIAPSLGRDLAAGVRATRTVQLIEPHTMRENRRRQLDLRVTRSFRVGRSRVLGTFEAFNALNANSVLRLTTRYGAAWLRPNEIVVGRLLKVGTQITF